MRGYIDIEAPKGELENLQYIVGYLKPYKLSLVGVFLALVISSSAVLSIGAGLRYIVDQGLSNNNPALLDQGLIVLLAVIVTLALATYLRFYLITRVGEKVVADIRRDVFNHILRLSSNFFETAKTGDIMSRITTDATILQIVIGSSLSVALRNIFLLFGGLFLLVATSAKLSFYIAIMIPVAVLPVLIMGKRVRILSRKAQEKVSDIASHVDETLTGIKTVQAYSREEVENRQFDEKVKNALEAATNRVKMRALLTALVIIVVFGSVGAILWAGGHDVIKGNITVGELSSFIFYSIIVASAFGSISEVIGDIQRAAGAAESLMELLNVDPDIKEVKNPISLPNIKKHGRVKLNKVKFSYSSKKDIPAVDNISFEAKPGQTIALVGPSGAGKSTILQLLLRFYDPKSGVIEIDGIDIKKLSLKELRNQFAYVSQDPVIFSSTARDNIAYGKQDASKNEIIEAAKAAKAYDFISKLPKKFNSFLGEKGVRISGGEKQRISIARAILKNPRILLLDEATSSLDARNEKQVQQALEKLMEDRTTIVIAHRLSTILKADKIIVLDEGKVVASGTHKELLKKNQLYKTLAELQFAA